MFSTKKYIPVIAAFIVGVTGAVGYAVHAQSSTSSVPSTMQVGTATTGTVSDGDGETADDTGAAVQTSIQDPKHTDGETADDVNASVSAQEVESGPADTGSDTGEVETAD